MANEMTALWKKNTTNQIQQYSEHLKKITDLCKLVNGFHEGIRVYTFALPRKRFGTWDANYHEIEFVIVHDMPDMAGQPFNTNELCQTLKEVMSYVMKSHEVVGVWFDTVQEILKQSPGHGGATSATFSENEKGYPFFRSPAMRLTVRFLTR